EGQCRSTYWQNNHSSSRKVKVSFQVRAGLGRKAQRFSTPRAYWRPGRTIRVARPPQGMDFNDVLTRGAA
ncbi:MAG TPA: hypothetical protein VJ924_16120, partial [Alphaproteobacteria bacterium]|nr:hypothetical protein [Alphaproteobacteria bacterium]